ncbi:MAG: hypothetical protein WAJ85_12640 [Candidatus Baltobacteraceae bacterium]|jgi:hypothetical protein
MKTLSSCLAAAVAVAALGVAVPARADTTPISFQIGPQLLDQTSGRNAGGDVQTDVGVNYDFGPKILIPVRASFQIDYSGGSHTGGNLSAYGFGVAARLTTPLYAGAGISLYQVNARQSYAGAPSYSWTGVGTNVFVGDTLFALPGGAGVSLQGTYKAVPSSQGIDPSGYSFDFRVQL